jgi:hypothetical protein
MKQVEQYLMIVNFDLSEAPAAYEGWQVYAGFDGWILRGNRKWEALVKGIGTVERSRTRSRGSISGHPRGIFLTSNVNASTPRDDFRFVGFDAGFFHDEHGHYSLLLHYVSRHPGDWFLNEHKLLTRAEDAASLVDNWMAWTPDNPDDKEAVEPGDNYRPFAVFAGPSLPEVRPK